jgi:hypothetical protein
MSADDNTPPPGLLFIPINDSFIWVKAGDCGTILLIKLKEGLHEVHIAIKPGILGNELKCLMKDAMHWGYDHVVGLNDMIAKIPAFNYKAMAFARRMGFQYQGIDDKPFIKDGMPYYKHIYIFRKEMTCLKLRQS